MTNKAIPQKVSHRSHFQPLSEKNQDINGSDTKSKTQPAIYYLRALTLAILTIAWNYEQEINQWIEEVWHIIRVQSWYTTV